MNMTEAWSRIHLPSLSTNDTIKTDFCRYGNEHNGLFQRFFLTLPRIC